MPVAALTASRGFMSVRLALARQPRLTSRYQGRLTFALPWNSPLWQRWVTLGPVLLIQVNPSLRDQIDVPAEPKTHTSALKRLCIGPGQGVLVIRPLFARAGVRTDTEDADAADHHQLRARKRSAAAFAPRAVVNDLHRILLGPSRRSKHFVKAVQVGARVGIRSQQPTLRPVVGFGR